MQISWGRIQPMFPSTKASGPFHHHSDTHFSKRTRRHFISLEISFQAFFLPPETFSDRLIEQWVLSASSQLPSISVWQFLFWLVAQMVKRLSIMRETRVQSLGWEDPLEKEMAIHSRTIAWKIPWTEEPGRLQSMGSQRVGHDWATSLSDWGRLESKDCVSLYGSGVEKIHHDVHKNVTGGGTA